MQHFILATLPVMWLLKQTCADSSLNVKMSMGPENKNDFYVEEGGSKDIECYVLGVESLRINLTWSGPSVNESLPQETSLKYPEEGHQQVGNWLNITQFSDAAAGIYTCRAITSKPQDLSRKITIAKSCEIGKFGPPSCTKSCSEHCKFKTGPDGAKGRNCDHINGACLNDCLDGYTGSMCTESGSLSNGAIAGIAVGVILLVLGVVLAVLDWRTKLIRNCIQAKVSKIPGFQAVPTSDPNQPPVAAPGAPPSSGPGIRAEEPQVPHGPPQEPQELHTLPLTPATNGGRNGSSSQNPVMEDTNHGERSVTRDGVDAGSGARPKQVANLQPHQEPPKVNRGDKDVPNSVPNQQLEVLEMVPRAIAPPPHTEEDTKRVQDSENERYAAKVENELLKKELAFKEKEQEFQLERAESKKKREEDAKRIQDLENERYAKQCEENKFLKEQLELKTESEKDLKKTVKEKDKKIESLHKYFQKEVDDRDETIINLREEMANLQSLRSTVTDRETRETLDQAAMKKSQVISDNEAEREKLKQQWKNEAKVLQEDRDRSTLAAFRRSSNLADEPTASSVASSSNMETEINDNGNFDDLSELDLAVKPK